MKGGATGIEVDPAVLGGTPVFAGTRAPARTLLDYLERGRSLAEFLADFPTVTRDQAVAALEEAKDAWLARARVPAESVIDLLDSWLEEDSKRAGGTESREQLKRSLDRDLADSKVAGLGASKEQLPSVIFTGAAGTTPHSVSVSRAPTTGEDSQPVGQGPAFSKAFATIIGYSPRCSARK